MPHAKLCRWYDGTWMYLVHQDTPLMPSFLLNYWLHDITPSSSTPPKTNETSKWSRWRRGHQMTSPDSTYGRQNSNMSPNFRKPYQKERVFKPLINFPGIFRYFSIFWGSNNFPKPHTDSQSWQAYKFDTNPYGTHPWITFQTAFRDPSNRGTLKTPHVLFFLNIPCWFLKHEALGSNFCWVSRNVVQNFNPKQPLKSWLLIS